ncbi:F-box protein At5g39450-like [Coffea arabica]|uniref:F-box protein At5g39450-like n=1 Tax=Coffea arabica TaxID=13443 RepID=A0A6P6TTX4_COFAR
MLPDQCGSSLLLHLPDDVLIIVTRSLTPKDLCNLGLCCRGLCELVASEKVWLAQCDKLGVVPYKDLSEWRKGVSSYKAICRFLVGVFPLLGIWVHQNPELGNVVYVMPGFVSVVGCRIIPQEIGPLGIEDGPILWAPVFEILCDFEGSAELFLHGRERDHDYVYPGSLKAVDRTCNVLLLEVEPRQQRNGGILAHSKSFAHDLDKDFSRKISRSDSGISKSNRIVGHNASMVPFSRLAFGDRRKLLDLVTGQVRLQVPDAKNSLLFPRLRGDVDLSEDIAILSERRLLLMQMYNLGSSPSDRKAGARLLLDPTQLEMSEIRKNMNCTHGCETSWYGDGSQTQCMKKKTLTGYFRDSFRHMLGKSNSINGSRETLKKNFSSGGNRHAQLHEFLHSGDTIGLMLHASTVKLSSYRAWPNMHDSRFALYKLPMREPVAGQEYSGLWGGTFGWPPGRPSEDKLGKALFFLLLSYEKSQGQTLLIATKILEGTHYVLHPNGSAMFIVNIDESSLEPFPWEADEDGHVLNVECAYNGEGIANGYGFRYPGSKPGSLFVIQDGLLAFVWRESKSVLTLQRLNLEKLLKKGERMHALPPVSNFAYLTRSYSNVFAAFSNSANTLSSQR